MNQSDGIYTISPVPKPLAEQTHRLIAPDNPRRSRSGLAMAGAVSLAAAVVALEAWGLWWLAKRVF